MKHILCAMLLVLSACAKPAPKDIPEVGQLRIIAAYQMAVMANADLKNAQATWDKKIAFFNEVCAAEMKAANIPDTMTCAPNVDTNKVTMVPKNPPTAKPAK